MTSRQQLARLLPLALLILLGIAGLHGDVTAPRWDGPLKAYGVVIGLVLEAILATALVITLRRDKIVDGSPARADVPARLRFALTWLLSAAMIAVAVLLIAGLHLRLFGPAKAPRLPRQPRPLSPKVPPAGRPVSGASHIPLGPILWGLLVALLLAAIAASIWWGYRQRRPAVPGRVPDDLAADSEGLRDAVESGRVALAELDDAREAIIACYAAMEATLADRGEARRSADTPDELLARAVTGGILRGLAAGAAEDLTTLFYEARFSSHPLGQPQRDAARQALDYLAAGLTSPAETSETAETAP